MFSDIVIKKHFDPGADLGFSRGGRADFQKKICPFFFRSTKLNLRALIKHYKDPVLANIYAPQAKFEKTGKKAFLGTFWKLLTKNLRFSARSPSKLV